MARFISLIRFTDKGANAIKQSTSRAHAIQKVAEKSGAKIEAHYWTLGSYDGVLVISAPKQEQALHCIALLSAAGFVRTDTMPAFTDVEFDEIVGQ
jgi:uncharacterized protein with GYD domain